MLKSLDQIEILRANERARISRWIRESEHGWLFYDRSGRAHRIDRDEAIELESAAQRRLERYIAGLRHLQMRVFLSALATGLYYAAASAMLPQEYDWLLPFTLVPFIVHFLFEGSAGLRFWLAQRAWRQEQAQRFQFRTEVPVEVEAHHRRHNLFRIASGAFALAAIGHAAWLALTMDPAHGISLTTLMLAAAAWLFFIPANRVDATHRRRKWLD